MNVLFVCADNASMSVIAEAVLNHVGSRRFQAYSAGVRPAASRNGLVLDFLAARDLPVRPVQPRHWREFTATPAPSLDFVITLSQAAAELPAQWPGHPVVAHWLMDDMADPAAPTEESVRDSFWELMRRIKIFSSLRLERSTRRTLQQRVEAIHAWQ